jgi:hypothetical protein
MPMSEAIRRYMRVILPEHQDPFTGEVNCTFLAEDACAYLDDHDLDGEVPVYYFEIAYEVNEEKASERPAHHTCL